MSLTNTTTSIMPFRQYDEHDVVQGFTWSGLFPVDKGTLVKIGGDGWYNTDEPTEFLGDIGNNVTNTVSERYGAAAKVVAAASGDSSVVLGMLLYDGRETDENGYPLKFEPRKAAEMNIFVSGQTCPILTRGLVLYSGAKNGTVSVSSMAYVSGQGQISVDQPAGATKVGKFLGKANANGFALLKLEL